MEYNEKNGFSIIGFIAQVLVILLFVFVLLWLFPTKSYVENRLNNATSVEGSDKATLNEILLNQNLLAMKDAAREYFTVSRMPSTQGSSKTLTLKEMIEKKMVVDFVDANGKKCDIEKSYVKVTKVGSEYEMEISLTCDGVTKQINTTVGCYNYCESGLCEKDEEILYQYSKTTPASSKWSDWSKWSKTVVTETSTRKVETKTVYEKTGTKEEKAIVTVDYSCPSGYSLSSDKKTCVKTSTEEKTIPSNVSYSCPSGYSLSSDKKSCSKTNYEYKDLVYYCSNGTLSGTKCKVAELVGAATMGSFSSLDSCKSQHSSCAASSVTGYYLYCKTGYLSGKQCYTNTTVNASRKCPSGYTKTSDGTRCYKTTTSTKASTPVYSCENGTLSSDNKSCIISISTTSSVLSIKKETYSCKTGKLSGNKCITDVYANVKYYRYKTYTTTKAKTVYKWSKSANDTALIKQGYKYTGVTKTTAKDEK